MIALGTDLEPLRPREHWVECTKCPGWPLMFGGPCSTCCGDRQVECEIDNCDCFLACDYCGSRHVELDTKTGRVGCHDCAHDNPKREASEVCAYQEQEHLHAEIVRLALDRDCRYWRVNVRRRRDVSAFDLTVKR